MLINPAYLLLLLLISLCCLFVYSIIIKPLANCYDVLIQKDIALNLELTETWTRVYQVLPSRTHPMMNMNGASGYLLSGIKIQHTRNIDSNNNNNNNTTTKANTTNTTTTPTTSPAKTKNSNPGDANNSENSDSTKKQKI